MGILSDLNPLNMWRTVVHHTLCELWLLVTDCCSFKCSCVQRGQSSSIISGATVGTKLDRRHRVKVHVPVVPMISAVATFGSSLPEFG
jgi:hypothetical protein